MWAWAAERVAKARAADDRAAARAAEALRLGFGELTDAKAQPTEELQVLVVAELLRKVIALTGPGR